MTETELNQVRDNLKEMNSFRAALASCQVPGTQVHIISNLDNHLKDVIRQLSDILNSELSKRIEESHE